MTLSDRIAAQSCAVSGCDRHRVQDSLFCSAHLNDMWSNRLTRESDGSFVPARRWTARDTTGELRLT